jgi:hypothetical protein
LSTIENLQLGDTLLILHWNEAVLANLVAANPAHTKGALIDSIVAQGGIQNVEGKVFGFRSAEDFSRARVDRPLWAATLGPVNCALVGMAVQDPVATAVLVLGTNRVLPDILEEPFFQTL